MNELNNSFNAYLEVFKRLSIQEKRQDVIYAINEITASFASLAEDENINIEYIKSKEIIKIISNLTMLPQVILATIDYEQYSSEVTIPTEVITLTEKRKLLCNEDYSSNESRILSIYSLLTST